MRRIFKYPLEITDTQTLVTGKNPEPLSVQYQHGKLTLWALVDDDSDMQDVETLSRLEIRIFGTGHAVDWEDAVLTFLGTVQDPTSVMPLVWHVFYEVH
jgi:hypothetical protein